jgi:MoxR-like ATPase
MIVDTKQAVNFITTAMKAKLVTMISGDPGIGKSAIVHDIAEQYKLELVDVRLSQCDPTDLNY